MRIHNHVFVPVLLVSCLLAACSTFSGGLSSNQQSAADNALKSLRKISAAIDVGVTYLQYGPMLIDAKAAVNEASALLPEGELKREMNAAMDAYADAQTVWEWEVESDLQPGMQPDTGAPLYSSFEPGKALIPRYSIPTQNGRVPCNYAEKFIWQIARKHLDNASAALNK